MECMLRKNFRNIQLCEKENKYIIFWLRVSEIMVFMATELRSWISTLA